MGSEVDPLGRCIACDRDVYTWASTSSGGECPGCMDKRLRTLATCLAQAGALCEAFDMGREYETDVRGKYGYRERAFSPGHALNEQGGE